MDENKPVLQLRVVVEAEDFDAAVRFYRDVLGLPERIAYAQGADDRVSILEAGRATLEIASPGHKKAIDEIEAGGQESQRIRLAFEVSDSEGMTRRLESAGARVVAEPVLTPWQSLNSRLDAPGNLQITLFQETMAEEQMPQLQGSQPTSSATETSVAQHAECPPRSSRPGTATPGAINHRRADGPGGPAPEPTPTPPRSPSVRSGRVRAP